MELGQRLRQARLEAGMSQRQLCGDEITRNMLSQIENGAASPSMATLTYLAGRLGKPISFFLEEETVTSPNQTRMDLARTAFSTGNYGAVAEALADFQEPDPVFAPEGWFLLAVSALRLGAQAAGEGRGPYARELLERAAGYGEKTPYYTPELERTRLLLLASLDPAQAATLPGDDDALLIRAEAALERGDPARCAQYLDAAEDRSSPRWNYLRGACRLAGKDYEAAARCFHLAEETFPEKVFPGLEQCYRELGDYKRAYEYACKRRL